MVERRVNHAWRHALSDLRAQRRLAGAADEPHPIAIANTALLGVMRVDFETILFVPDDIVGATGLRANIILGEDAAGSRNGPR
jgi:hypothetical protein